MFSAKSKSCFLQEPKPKLYQLDIVHDIQCLMCHLFIYPGAVFFSFKNKINHSVLKDLLDPIKELYEDVRRKALMRLEYEGLHKSEAITMSGARFHNNPAGFAMNRYAYYVCFKCKKVRSFSVLFANLQWNTNVFSRIFLLYSA